VSLSDVELAAVVAEVAPRLRGATLGKVWQPAADTLLLELGREELLVSAHPRAARIHLAGARAPAAGPPPAFAMLLRKRLGGHRLHELRTLGAGERVVELDFGAGRDRLVAELTGPHANVFLVDGAGLVAASLRPSSSTTRALAPGAPYSPPPPAPLTAGWRGRNRFAAAPEVSTAIAAHYQAELAGAEERELRQRLEGALRRELDRIARREHALRGDLERIAAAAEYRKWGDLLLAHAHELPGRGATSATVPDDFIDGAPLTITLDPTLDARQNAARLYRQHKRMTAGRKHAEKRLADTLASATAARKKLEAIAALTLDELRRRAERAPPPPRERRRREPPERLPYREYTSLSGDKIYVGRSAADNDTLTFRVARGSDMWFHCRDAPGSHVVVPTRGKHELSEATFLDAASLAAHHSPLRNEAQVDVTYAHVKSLRKPRGAPPGLVFVSEGKTIRIRLEPERLARLLAAPALDP
jgi:predicted ribosome quality control (RQC) complex YloA/Tae2 family protein